MAIKMKMNWVRSTLLVVLAAFAIPAWADNQCIRAGSREIILYDAAPEPCHMKFSQGDGQLVWKFASDNGRPSCWRDDEIFVYVSTSSGIPNIYPIESIEDLSVCTKFMDHAMERAVEEIWAREVEECENFDLPGRVAELACCGALVLAERYFGGDDPRLLLSIENLSARTDDIAEEEQLLKRSIDIRQKQFASDHVGLVAVLRAKGTLRKKQRDIDGAEAAYLEAIRVGRQHLGDDDPEVIVSTLVLGKMYLDVGMLPKAEEQLLLTLVHAEKRRPTDLSLAHGIAAISARLLADMYQRQSKGAEADRYREIAQAHREAEKQPVKQEINSQSGNYDES